MDLHPLPPLVPAFLVGELALVWTLVVRHLGQLRDLPEAPQAPEGGLCLCIPARNEAAEVGRALDSWLAQDLPDFRILVVDDGSTDGTSEILAARADAHPDRLVVLRNEALPPGWLGKNHALHLATGHPWAQEAAWLLFADADVRVAAGLPGRALAHAQAEGMDVLALVPAVESEGFWERLLLPFGAALFTALVPPRAVERPGSPAFCGIGAFTLIRREAYDRIGGHAGAPMEPIDDMRLAQRAKAAGFHNGMARGGPELRLRMYHGLGDLMRGMRKNIMSVPGLWPIAPLLALLTLGISFGPLLLALGGWPATGLGLWLGAPAVAGEVRQRFLGRGGDLLLALWPLLGVPVALAILWAFLDRLRGINHWRGRAVRIRGKAS